MSDKNGERPEPFRGRLPLPVLILSTAVAAGSRVVARVGTVIERLLEGPHPRVDLREPWVHHPDEQEDGQE
jgi:hypothetical protein